MCLTIERASEVLWDVPLWSEIEVQKWIRQIGFADYEKDFASLNVDGDLLLQMNETNLREDIGMKNGIMRNRFKRELDNLKKVADYSSLDVETQQFLESIGPDFTIYTYPMVKAGIDGESLKNLTDDQLIKDCGIQNSIHRARILKEVELMKTPQSPINTNMNLQIPPKSIADGSILKERITKKTEPIEFAQEEEEDDENTFDVFISYRNGSGSELAYLLNEYLQFHGYSVYFELERSEINKHHNNIRKAKNFVLLLTTSALDLCMDDYKMNDWVHKEIVTAITSGCNIIPVVRNFQWPEITELPEDIREVHLFNAIQWVDDYQDACVEKLMRFMGGKRNTSRSMSFQTTYSMLIEYNNFGNTSLRMR